MDASDIPGTRGVEAWMYESGCDMESVSDRLWRVRILYMGSDPEYVDDFCTEGEANRIVQWYGDELGLFAEAVHPATLISA